MNKEKSEIPWETVGLVEPPERLDDRVKRLIAAAEIHRSMSRKGVPARAVAVACSACLVLGFIASRLTSDLPGHQMREPAVVIEISPEELPPSFFVTKSRRKAPFFERQLHDVEIEIPKGNGGTEL